MLWEGAGTLLRNGSADTQDETYKWLQINAAPLYIQLLQTSSAVPRCKMLHCQPGLISFSLPLL